MKRFITLLIISAVLLCGCLPVPVSFPHDEFAPSRVFSLDEIPEFFGEPYIVINDNEPDFTAEDIVTEGYEYFSPLDELGRCGLVMACLGTELMPTEPRGEIGMIKPSGWQIAKYDNVDGKYLYNRCHLIGFQLSGENANAQNLITGTRYMNVQGMLPFENMVADYIKETNNHVMYRVIPIYQGDNLLAHGVLMEAYSVEDNGEGICFNVFCYNAQPNIAIDYSNGDSEYCETIYDTPDISDSQGEMNDITYILNTSSKKFHYPNCSSVESMKEENRQSTSKSRDELLSDGYSPCGACNP